MATAKSDDAHGHAHDHAPGSSCADGHPERISPGDSYWESHLPEHRQRYEFAAARLVAGSRVLDAGCGVGYGTALLMDQGAGLAVGVDVSAEALAVARARFDRPGIHWIREDCVSLTEAGAHGPFDLIVNFENIEHVSDAEQFLDRVAHLLAPDGVFVLSTPNRSAMNRVHGAGIDAPSANPFHTVEFSADELRRMLAKRFGTIVLFHQTFDPPERFLYEPILSLLWSNPFARLGRWLQRVLRRRPMAHRVEDLLPPRSHQIVAADPGPYLAVTTLAECRRPLHLTGTAERT